jgi:hypothetical protein
LWSWYWKSSGPELLVLEARHQHPLLLGIIGAFVLFLLMHWPQSAFDTLLEPAWSFFCPELALGSSSPAPVYLVSSAPCSLPASRAHGPGSAFDTLLELVQLFSGPEPLVLARHQHPTFLVSSAPLFSSCFKSARPWVCLDTLLAGTGSSGPELLALGSSSTAPLLTGIIYALFPA